MFGASGSSPAQHSRVFVSKASLDTVAGYGLHKKAVAVRACRGIGKKDMRLNDVLPKIEIDPETYVVRVDGAILRCDPASVLPLAQLYHLF